MVENKEKRREGPAIAPNALVENTWMWQNQLPKHAKHVLRGGTAKAALKSYVKFAFQGCLNLKATNSIATTAPRVVMKTLLEAARLGANLVPLAKASRRQHKPFASIVHEAHFPTRVV